MDAVFAADAEIGSDAVPLPILDRQRHSFCCRCRNRQRHSFGSDTVFAADAEIGSDAVFAADFSMNSDAELGGRGKTGFR